MLFHLVHLVLSMRIFIIKHYSTEVEKQNRFYEKNELCINKEVYAKERVERLRRDRVAVICRDSNPVTTVYTVIGNPVLRTLLSHANKMPTFMPETGAFKDNIKADSERFCYFLITFVS